MDEKGDNVLGMDDESGEERGGQEEDHSEKVETEENAADAPIPYPIENARQTYMVGNNSPHGLKAAAAMCDKPVQKMSLKEKLEAFKAQAAGTDRTDTEKAKRKEETL